MKRFMALCALMLGVALGGCSEKKEEPGPEPGADAGQPGAGPAALKSVAEVEPNDKTNQAMELRESVVIQASLEPADAKGRSQDWYKLVTGSRKQVAFELSAVAGEDVQLVFRDADLNELFSVDSGGKGEGEQYPNLTVPDACYVKVEGSKGGAGGAYQLSVRIGEPVAGQETEFNGRYSTASELALGKPISGFLAHQRDEDWYLVKLTDAPVGSVLRIDLTGVEGVRFQLVASDHQERRPLIDTKSAESGAGIVVRNLGLTAGAEAIYLTVKSAWVPGPQPKKYTRTSNPKQTYTLSVSAEAGGDDLEKEPNDDAAHAFGIADGQKIRAYLSAADDEDWYKIQVERPSILSAELSALNRVDLQLYVVNPDKKDERRSQELVRINDGIVNEPEVLTNCALQPGENFIKVNGAFKKVDSKWIQDGSNLDETYSLTVNLRTDDGREEREPNDRIEQATSISVGASLRGSLHPKGDVDSYKLDLSGQAGPITTTIECTGIPKVDLGLKLLGPERDDKGNPKLVDSSTKGKDEEREQISKELMPGEYWIVISAPRFSESNTSDQYVLTVTQ